MTTLSSLPNRPIDRARSLLPRLAERARSHDLEGSFVADNYRDLKEQKLMSAGIPAELGGGGASHGELCELLVEVAKSCGSTALALSMHTHLVAAAVWRHRHGQPAEPLLRKIAAGELVLVSTGAGDWVESVGRAERVPEGYRITATKRFASGCTVGDIMMTSAPYDDPERGAEVLHFALPLKSPGISIREDWDTLGMRATGSHTVELKDVLLPEEAISLRRPRGSWHPSWSVIVTVAAPLYIAPYVGVAERAAELARAALRRREPDAIALQSLGEVENALATARMGLRELIANANGYDFEPSVERANQALIAKTITSNAAIATVQKTLEVLGGSGLYRQNELERLLRDVQGAPFHPLPEKRQLAFSARVALGLDPVARS